MKIFPFVNKNQSKSISSIVLPTNHLFCFCFWNLNVLFCFFSIFDDNHHNSEKKRLVNVLNLRWNVAIILSFLVLFKCVCVYLCLWFCICVVLLSLSFIIRWWWWWWLYNCRINRKFSFNFSWTSRFVLFFSIVEKKFSFFSQLVFSLFSSIINRISHSFCLLLVNHHWFFIFVYSGLNFFLCVCVRDSFLIIIIIVNWSVTFFFHSVLIVIVFTCSLFKMTKMMNQFAFPGLFFFHQLMQIIIPINLIWHWSSTEWMSKKGKTFTLQPFSDYHHHHHLMIINLFHNEHEIISGFKAKFSRLITVSFVFYMCCVFYVASSQ